MLGNINKNLQNIPETSELSGKSPYFVQENCFSDSYNFLLIIGSEYCGTSRFIFCETLNMIYLKVLLFSLFCFGDSY